MKNIVVRIALLAAGVVLGVAPAAYAQCNNTTIYTSDGTLADFTSLVGSFAQLDHFSSGDKTAPYTPTSSTVASGSRVYGGTLTGTGLATTIDDSDVSQNWIRASFPSRVSTIVVFPNIDHFGSAFDGYQYTIAGSNDGTNWTVLYDAVTVNGSDTQTGEPFTLGCFTGTAPTTVNNVLTPGLGPGGTVGYEAQFTFGTAYQYYAFGASTEAFNSGNTDSELSAVATTSQSTTLSGNGGSFNFGWPGDCNPNQTLNACDYTFGVTYPAGMFQDGSTATVTPTEITQPEWAQRTPEENPYFGTDIAQVAGKGGKGVVFSADCSGPCASSNSSNFSYTTKTSWKSEQTNYCGSGPGLLDADPIASDNWVNTLINCTQISTDPTYGTGGTKKCTTSKCLSDWANVFNIGGPIASASPFLVDCGKVPFFGFCIKSITLKNIGISTLSISSVKVASASGGEDDFGALSLCFEPLDPGKSCTIFVGFFADDLGPQSATLTVTDTANGSPHLIPLTATVKKK